jgi:V/A-type H+-transporting ATPase subunit D
MAKEVKATRSELLRIKKQIKLAKSGHSLLKKKRDGLMIELFEVLKQAKTLRQDIVNEYQVGLEKMNIARTLEGDLKIKSTALAVKQISDIQVQKKNIMGVKVLKIEASELKDIFKQRNYSFYSSSAISEAADSYRKTVEKVLLAAEIETTMRKLLNEIEKTIRKVNALEFVVLPRLTKQKAFIQLRLEEMEREGIFGMKKIKAKKRSRAK